MTSIAWSIRFRSGRRGSSLRSLRGRGLCLHRAARGEALPMNLDRRRSTSSFTCDECESTKSTAMSGCWRATASMMPALVVFPGSSVIARRARGEPACRPWPSRQFVKVRPLGRVDALRAFAWSSSPRRRVGVCSDHAQPGLLEAARDRPWIRLHRREQALSLRIHLRISDVAERLDGSGRRVVIVGCSPAAGTRPICPSTGA